jgi:hypothetical protein
MNPVDFRAFTGIGVPVCSASAGTRSGTLLHSNDRPTQESVSLPAARKSRGIDPIEKTLWGLLIFSLPFTDVQFPKQARGFGEPSTYLTIVLWVFVLLRILRRKESLRFLKSKPFLFMFLFWLVAGLSILQSSKAPPSPWIDYSNPWKTSVEQFVQLSVSLSIVFFTVFYVRSWRDFRIAMSAYFAGWVGSLFAQMLDFAAYFRPESTALSVIENFIHHTGWWQFLGPIPRLRLGGAEASWCSDYLLCLIPFFVLRAYYWKSRMWNAVNATASVLILFGTMSFGGLAAFFGEVVLMAFALGRRAIGFLLLAGAVPLLMALVISPIYVSWVWDRAMGVYENGIQGSDYSVRIRTALTEAAWNTFEEHPWLGVGIGNSTFYILGDMPGWAMADPDIKASFRDPINVPDFYAQILSETGLLGTGLFVMMLASMALGLFRAHRSAPERWKKSVYIGILIVLLGQVAHYVSVNRFFIHYWYFIWGLAICAPRLLSQNDPKISQRCAVVPKFALGVLESQSAKVLRRAEFL